MAIPSQKVRQFIDGITWRVLRALILSNSLHHAVAAEVRTSYQADTKPALIEHRDGLPAYDSSKFDGSEHVNRLLNTSYKPSISIDCHILLFKAGGKPLNGQLKNLSQFIDERAAVERYGASPIIRTRNGLRYLLSKDLVGSIGIGEAHRDQCLATLAAMELPLETPVLLVDGKASFNAFLRESIANFTWEQGELTWTACAYARYLPPAKEWKDRFGRQYSFSELVHKLINNQKKLSCSGTHVLEALICISNAEKLHSILTTETRLALDGWLDTTVKRLSRQQYADGSWRSDWQRDVRSAEKDPLASQLIITGHILDFVRKMPPERQPDGTVLMRARHWLTDYMQNRADVTSIYLICPLTHAVNALSNTGEIQTPTRN